MIRRYRAASMRDGSAAHPGDFNPATVCRHIDASRRSSLRNLRESARHNADQNVVNARRFREPASSHLPRRKRRRRTAGQAGPRCDASGGYGRAFRPAISHWPAASGEDARSTERTRWRRQPDRESGRESNCAPEPAPAQVASTHTRRLEIVHREVERAVVQLKRAALAGALGCRRWLAEDLLRCTARAGVS